MRPPFPAIRAATCRAIFRGRSRNPHTRKKGPDPGRRSGLENSLHTNSQIPERGRAVFPIKKFMCKQTRSAANFRGTDADSSRPPGPCCRAYKFAVPAGDSCAEGAGPPRKFADFCTVAEVYSDLEQKNKKILAKRCKSVYICV